MLGRLYVVLELKCGWAACKADTLPVVPSLGTLPIVDFNISYRASLVTWVVLKALYLKNFVTLLSLNDNLTGQLYVGWRSFEDL